MAGRTDQRPEQKQLQREGGRQAKSQASQQLKGCIQRRAKRTPGQPGVSKNRRHQKRDQQRRRRKRRGQGQRFVLAAQGEKGQPDDDDCVEQPKHDVQYSLGLRCSGTGEIGGRGENAEQSCQQPGLVDRLIPRLAPKYCQRQQGYEQQNDLN